MTVRLTTLATVYLFGVGCSGPLTTSGDEPLQAERVTVYSAKQIVTMDPTHPVATAVAVSDGRILAVGSRDEVVATLHGRELVEATR